MTNETNSELPLYQKTLICYPLFLLMALAFFAVFGILATASGIIIDIILAISFCFTVVIPLVITGAKQPAELARFPHILFATLVLRIIFIAALCKSGFVNHSPGNILSFLTDAAPTSNTAALIAIGIVAIFSTIAITASAIFMAKKAAQNIDIIIPAKIKGVKDDISSGRLSPTDAIKLYERINLERAYNDGISSVSKILFFEGWILAAAIFITMQHCYGQGSRPMAEPNCFVATAIGGIIIYILAAIAAAASAKISAKSSFKLKKVDPSYKKAVNNDFQKALNMAQKKDFELVNPDFDSVSKLIENIDSTNITEDGEFSDEAKESDDSFADSEPNAEQYQNMDEFYEDLSVGFEELILKDIDTFALFAKPKTLLPVTVPVNIAIRLTQRKWRVLLVDSDENRNAISEVFEISSSSTLNEITTTFVEDLSIVKNIEQDKLEEIRQNGDFDAIITYISSTTTEKIKKLCQKNQAIIAISDDRDFKIRTEAIALNNNCEQVEFYQIPKPI